MLRVAITGNIASGKSQVEKILSDLGYSVYDTDKIAHVILDNMTEFYGYDVFINGKIDRKKLAALVFSDKNIKSKLENLVHPIIKKKISDIFDSNSNKDVIFISVPLLYEAKFDDIFDKVLLITVNSNLQLKRLTERNNISNDEAILRIKSQLSQELKMQKADYIIENNSSLEDLKLKVCEFIEQIKS